MGCFLFLIFTMYFLRNSPRISLIDAAAVERSVKERSQMLNEAMRLNARFDRKRITDETFQQFVNTSDGVQDRYKDLAIVLRAAGTEGGASLYKTFMMGQPLPEEARNNLQAYLRSFAIE